MVFASPYVMHRLEQYFPDPACYDPRRFTPEREAMLPRYVYFPFGGGPHICIGNAFAALEGQLLLATIAQRYRFEIMPDPPVVPDPLITLGMKNGIRMRLLRAGRHVLSRRPWHWIRTTEIQFRNKHGIQRRGLCDYRPRS